jgi:hypothetical protein
MMSYHRRTAPVVAVCGLAKVKTREKDPRVVSLQRG